MDDSFCGKEENTQEIPRKERPSEVLGAAGPRLLSAQHMLPKHLLGHHLFQRSKEC